jgi:phage protein U
MIFDSFKNLGGKLNLNSALGINMMMILGAYRFAISSAAFQNFKRQSEYRWSEINRIGADPALQFTGFGVETIDLDGVIYPHFKGGLRQVTLMRAEAGLGKPLYLISGNGNAFGKWCIVKILENQSVFMKDGAPLKIEFSISLKRYGEDAKPGVKGIIQNIVKAI